MAEDPRARVTAILSGLSGGAPAPAEAAELLPLVYDELRDLAGRYFRRERPGHTLQATALVHEAYERLADQSRVEWRGRTHFKAVAAVAMRRLLVDHARGRDRAKRGGANRQQVTLSDLPSPAGGSGLDPADLLALEDALARLAAEDERAAKGVELRCFGGLAPAEIAEQLGVSERTVRNDWTHARAWLRLELTGADGS